MAKEYGGIVRKIEGERAVVDIAYSSDKIIEVIFHKDTLSRYDLCREGEKIKYIPDEKKFKKAGIFEKIGIKKHDIQNNS